VGYSPSMRWRPGLIRFEYRLARVNRDLPDFVLDARRGAAEVGGKMLAATLFAHEPATFGEHGSAGLYDHGGPLAASMSTISPG